MLANALPAGLELRRDRPLPTDENFKTSRFFCIYVDNMDGADFSRDQEQSDFHTLFLEVKEVGRSAGISYHDGDKSVAFGDLGKTLGGQNDTVQKTTRPIMKKIVNVIGQTVCILGFSMPLHKDVEVLTGSWIHLIQFRRPIMGAVEDIWNVLVGDLVGTASVSALRDDFLRLLTLAPLTSSKWSQEVDESATASDASEKGGGVCATTSLTNLGLRRLAEAESLRLNPPADGLLLVDAFGGISAARRALQLLGIAPGTHVSYETDEYAKLVARENFQDIRELGDIKQATAQSLAEAVSDNPHLQHVVCIAGFPCQDLSGANRQRKGLQGERSSLIHDFEYVEKTLLPAVLPDSVTESIVENVFSMTMAARGEITELRGVEPLKVCPTPVWPMSRPRLFWISYAWPSGDYGIFNQRGDYTEFQLTSPPRDVGEFLPANCRVSAAFSKFPTFMRSKTRDKPPFLPNGVDTCSEDELKLWEQSGYRLPPYHFKIANMVYNLSSNSWSPPAVEVREKLMCFRPGFTEVARGKHKTLGKREQVDIRESLLGNSMHAGTLATLLAPLMESWGYLVQPLDVAKLGKASEKKVGTDGSSAELRLIRAYLSYQDARGGRMIQESGPLRLRAKPACQSVDVRQWNWKTVLSCTWEVEGDHINSLECRALLLALRWRSRSAASLGKRFLHLVDSMVALGAFAKHRSNSRAFNYLVTRSAALQLAFGMTPILAHVRTSRNPADFPSRVRVNLQPCAARKEQKGGGETN